MKQLTSYQPSEIKLPAQLIALLIAVLLALTFNQVFGQVHRRMERGLEDRFPALGQAPRKKWATLTRRLSAIRKWHELHENPFPLDDRWLRATLKGIQREHGTHSRQAPAFGTAQLMSILRGLVTEQNGVPRFGPLRVRSPCCWVLREPSAGQSWWRSMWSSFCLATTAKLNGADDSEVMQQTKHKTSAMIRRYTRLDSIK